MLEGPAGVFVVVEPLRHDTLPVRTPSDDYDANSMRGRIVIAAGAWSIENESAFFFAWEVHSLTHWIRALAQGVPLLVPSWSHIDHELEMVADEVDGRVRIRVHAGIWPGYEDADLPTMDPEHIYHLELFPTANDLAQFADQLLAELAPFPVRAVGSAGPARRYLRNEAAGSPALHVRFRHETVPSTDGTSIGTWRTGQGPTLVLLTESRWDWSRVVPALASRFTVVAVAGRGWYGGMSGPYRPDHVIERDFEDAVAVIEAQGEPAHLLANGFGALCALEAARRTMRVRRMVLDTPLLTATDDELDQANRMERSLGHAASVTVRVRVRTSYRFDPSAFVHMSEPTLVLVGEAVRPHLRLWAQTVADSLPRAELVILPTDPRLDTLSADPDAVVRRAGAFFEERQTHQDR